MSVSGHFVTSNRPLSLQSYRGDNYSAAGGTDQGSQFTSEDFTDVRKRHGVRISVDGKGRWVDNVFIERLWRSVKYEEVYLRAYDSIGDVRVSLGRYFAFYNAKRRHQSLDRRTPDSVCYQMAARLVA